MNSFQQRIVLVAVCTFFTLLSFYLHVSSYNNTMINYVAENHPNHENLLITNGFLPWAVDYHSSFVEHVKRPTTTYLVVGLSKLTGLRISIAFVWVNFGVLFLSGFVVYYLARIYEVSYKNSLLSVAFFYSSFSVLLAYFIPIATYDEPIQYFLILLSFVFFKKKSWLLFILTFTLAVITRESSLILLPGITLTLLNINFRKIFHEKIRTIRLLVPVVLPVVFFLIYLIWFYKTNPEVIEGTKDLMDDRFSIFYRKNLVGINNITSTILAFLSVYLLPFFLIRIYDKKHIFSDFEKRLMNAFWITFFINTPVVLFYAYVEECRVLTLPLLLIFPIFGKIIHQSIEYTPSFLKYLIHPKRIIIPVVATGVAWLFFNYTYGLTDFDKHENLFRQYNTIAVLIISIVWLYQRYNNGLKKIS